MAISGTYWRGVAHFAQCIIPTLEIHFKFNVGLHLLLPWDVLAPHRPRRRPRRACWPQWWGSSSWCRWPSWGWPACSCAATWRYARPPRSTADPCGSRRPGPSQETTPKKRGESKSWSFGNQLERYFKRICETIQQIADSLGLMDILFNVGSLHGKIKCPFLPVKTRKHFPPLLAPRMDWFVENFDVVGHSSDKR